MRNLDSRRCWRYTLCPCKVRNKFLVNFWNRTILLCILCIKILSVAMELQHQVNLQCCRATNYVVLLSTMQKYLGLHVNTPRLLSDFKQIWFFSAYFHISLTANPLLVGGELPATWGPPTVICAFTRTMRMCLKSPLGGTPFLYILTNKRTTTDAPVGCKRA